MQMTLKKPLGGTRSAGLMGLGLGLCAACALAGDEYRFRVLDSGPNKLLVAKLTQLFAESGAVSVKYTNLEEVESTFYNEDIATRDWQYLYSRQCETGCGYVGVELHRRLATGVRVDRECPPPFAMVIEFYGQNHEHNPKHRIYVDFVGTCFMLDDQSYFERDQSLLELVNRRKGPLA